MTRNDGAICATACASAPTRSCIVTTDEYSIVLDMSGSFDELYDRAAAYAASIEAVLGDMLGSGNDGKVWLAIGPGQSRSVIKALERETGFQRELECYERLEEFEVRQIQGLTIPRLLGSDSELLVIEIGLVTPPRLIDFAKAYLDFEPEFTPEVWADWEQDRRERFGSRWNDALKVREELKSYRIFYSDLSPAKIDFGDDH